MLLPSPDWRRFHQLWMTNATLILGENSDSAGWLLAHGSHSERPGLSAAPGIGYEGVAWKTTVKKSSPQKELCGPKYVEHLWFVSCAMKETCVGQWSPQTLLLVSAYVSEDAGSGMEERQDRKIKIMLRGKVFWMVPSTRFQPTPDSYWCLLSFTHSLFYTNGSVNLCSTVIVKYIQINNLLFL